MFLKIVWDILYSDLEVGHHLKGWPGGIKHEHPHDEEQNTNRTIDHIDEHDRLFVAQQDSFLSLNVAFHLLVYASGLGLLLNLHK